MRRLLVFVQRPQHLARAEAASWLQEATADLVDADGVTAVDVVELEDASARWSRDCDWLLELSLSADASPARCVDSAAAAALLADLRLLGMRPRVMVTAP